MTSNHHAPYDLGYTRATMVGTKRSEAVTWSKPHKANLSSDCRLQLAYMKSESQTMSIKHMQNASLNLEDSIDNISSAMGNIRDNTHNIIEVSQNITNDMNDSITAVNQSSKRIEVINNRVQNFKGKIGKIE